MTGGRLLGPATSRRRAVARSARALVQAPTTLARLEVAARQMATGHTYRAIGELMLRRWPTGPSVDLRGSEFRVFSQNGEDGVLAALRDAMSPAHPFFVEFGVQDGAECNTRFLAEVLGWPGVYFEPDPAGFAALDRRYSATDRVRCAPEAVTPDRVGEQFERMGVPGRFAVLSIDVDGQDYWIWEALPERFRPDVVVVECNTLHPMGRAVVERRGRAWAWPLARNFGASVEALRLLGERKGYRLVHVELTGVNAFFVREELVPAGVDISGIIDRSANHHLQGRGSGTFGPDADVVEFNS